MTPEVHGHFVRLTSSVYPVLDTPATACWLAHGLEVAPFRGRACGTFSTLGPTPRVLVNTFRLGDLFHFETGGICVSDRLRLLLEPHVAVRFESVDIVQAYHLPFSLEDLEDDDLGLAPEDRQRVDGIKIEFCNDWIRRIAARHACAVPLTRYHHVLAPTLDELGIEIAAREIYKWRYDIQMNRDALAKFGMLDCAGYLMRPDVHAGLEPFLDPSFFLTVRVPLRLRA